MKKTRYEAFWGKKSPNGLKFFYICKAAHTTWYSVDGEVWRDAYRNRVNTKEYNECEIKLHGGPLKNRVAR